MEIFVVPVALLLLLCLVWLAVRRYRRHKFLQRLARRTVTAALRPPAPSHLATLRKVFGTREFRTGEASLALGFSEGYTSRLLKKMSEEGYVQDTGWGRWRIEEEEAGQLREPGEPSDSSGV